MDETDCAPARKETRCNRVVSKSERGARRVAMSHFLYKLLPPRPTFARDMSEAEGAILHKHFAYWADAVAQRKAVAYGPVLDPRGFYGIAVVESENRGIALNLANAD